MGQHQLPDALTQDQFENVIEAFLASVQAGTEIGNNLISPTSGGAKRLEQFLLADQIVLLVVARHPGIADRRHVLVAEAQDFPDIVIARAAFAAAIGDKLTRLLPLAQVCASTPSSSTAFPILTRAIFLVETFL